MKGSERKERDKVKLLPVGMMTIIEGLFSVICQQMCPIESAFPLLFSFNLLLFFYFPFIQSNLNENVITAYSRTIRIGYNTHPRQVMTMNVNIRVILDEMRFNPFFKLKNYNVSWSVCCMQIFLLFTFIFRLHLILFFFFNLLTLFTFFCTHST